MSDDSREQIWAARWNPIRRSEAMLQGWRERVERARRIVDEERRADQLRTVTFTAEETVAFLRGLQ